MSYDGRYLIVLTSVGFTDNLPHYADLAKIGEITGKITLTPIPTKFKGVYEVSELQSRFFHDTKSTFTFFQYITNMGSKVVFRTNNDAPNYRLIVIDFDNPDERNWKTLIKVKF